MARVPLGKILIEQKESVGTADGNNLPLIGVSNVIGLHLSRQKRLADVSRYKLLKKNWFAYNPMRINVGSIGYADADEKTGIISPDYVVFSCSEKIHPEYFFHFIKSDIGLREIAKNTGGSVRERLYFHNLSKIEIELPDIIEQEKIVTSLNKKKELIDTLANESKLLEQDLQYLRRCILQEAVQGKLTPQVETDEPAAELLGRIKAERQKLVKEGKLKKEKELPPITEEEIPFELPEGWVWCRLGEIMNLISGVTLGKSYKGELIKVPYLRVANVQRGFIDTSNTKELFVPQSEIDKYSLEEGDLCMIEGGDWDKVGRCAIWKGEVKPCIHQNHIFRLRFYGGILNSWAELYLNSPIARRYFESCSKQTTNLASINQTQLKNALIALPPLEEQNSIVGKVQQNMRHLDQLEEQVLSSQKQTQQLFQAMLKEAFAGKVKEYISSESLTLAAEA